MPCCGRSSAVLRFGERLVAKTMLQAMFRRIVPAASRDEKRIPVPIHGQARTDERVSCSNKGKIALFVECGRMPWVVAGSKRDEGADVGTRGALLP